MGARPDRRGRRNECVAGRTHTGMPCGDANGNHECTRTEQRSHMSYTIPSVPASWSGLRAETQKEYFRELRAFVKQDAGTHEIFPPARDVFNALELTPLRNVR